jgi:hypothetical protein
MTWAVIVRGSKVVRRDRSSRTLLMNWKHITQIFIIAFSLKY